jgi:hypothetical protein
MVRKERTASVTKLDVSPVVFHICILRSEEQLAHPGIHLPQPSTYSHLRGLHRFSVTSYATLPRSSRALSTLYLNTFRSSEYHFGNPERS